MGGKCYQKSCWRVTICMRPKVMGSSVQENGHKYRGCLPCWSWTWSGSVSTLRRCSRHSTTRGLNFQQTLHFRNSLLMQEYTHFTQLLALIQRPNFTLLTFAPHRRAVGCTTTATGKWFQA